MATIGQSIRLGRFAAADLSAKRYYAVILDSNDKLAIAGAGVKAFPLEDAPNINVEGTITIAGAAKVAVGAATALFDRLTPDANGRWIKAVTGDFVGAIGLKAGAAAQDIIEAMIVGMYSEGGIEGVAAGYKIARGVMTPTTASDTVVTGLATVVAAFAEMNSIPDLTHTFTAADIGDQAGTPAAGSILILTSKATGAGDVTPINATTPWNEVDWLAIGT